MLRRPALALALTLALALAACGDGKPAGPSFVAVPGVPWALVTQAQVDAARAMGVPVARELEGTCYVYIPAGMFERTVGEGRYEVNIGVGFYVGIAPFPSAATAQGKQFPGMSEGRIVDFTHGMAAAAAGAESRRDALWSYRLPTEAEWEYAQRFLAPAYKARQAGLREWVLDRFAPLPTWTVSDPHGPREGERFVVVGGDRRAGLPAGTQAGDLGFRLVSPLGYGLGKYGSTDVTFRMVDEFAAKGAEALRGGYDLRIISMNDRLQARTMGVETDWTLVPSPGSPVTLTMVPGAYYVYAERTQDGKPLRGKEMKFYVGEKPIERLVPIPEKDQQRYGSGGREKPQ